MCNVVVKIVFATVDITLLATCFVAHLFAHELESKTFGMHARRCAVLSLDAAFFAWTVFTTLFFASYKFESRNRVSSRTAVQYTRGGGERARVRIHSTGSSRSSRPDASRGGSGDATASGDVTSGGTPCRSELSSPTSSRSRNVDDDGDWPIVHIRGLHTGRKCSFGSHGDTSRQSYVY